MREVVNKSKMVRKGHLLKCFLFQQEIELKVEEHKLGIDETLKKGIQLSNGDRFVPDIIVDQIETLERLWARVQELVIEKRKDLEEYSEQWKNYIKELEKIMGKLEENESFLNQNVDHISVGSEENAKEKIQKYKVRLLIIFC